MTDPARDASPTAASADWLRGGALAALALALLCAVAHEGARAEVAEGIKLLARGDTDALRAWGTRLGPWAVAGTTALMIAQAIAAPIPAVLVTWTNSWLFGPLAGGLLSIAQATLAAAICFLLARGLGGPVVRRLLSPAALARADALVARHGARAVLIARLLPFVPFDPISYVAGLSTMRLGPFVLATLVGQTPAGLAYAYLGQEIAEPARLALGAACVLTALVVIGHAARRGLLRSES